MPLTFEDIQNVNQIFFYSVLSLIVIRRYKCKASPYPTAVSEL